jgi:hypothetical protein
MFLSMIRELTRFNISNPDICEFNDWRLIIQNNMLFLIQILTLVLKASSSINSTEIIQEPLLS